MQEFRTKINENGRLVIPAAYRKALELAPGEEVIVRLENDELRIAKIGTALSRARELVRRHVRTKKNLTQDLIKERHREAKREQGRS